MKNYTFLLGNVSFEGRARRSEWWSTILWTVFWASIGCSGICFIYACETAIGVTYNDVVENTDLLFRRAGLLIIFCVFRIVPVTVRRLHDRGLSGGWYVLLWLSQWFPYVDIICGIIFLINVGCLEGDPGENDYGPNPRGREKKNKNVEDPISDNIKYRLKELGALKQQGFINENEYEAHKNRILLESENESQGEIWDDSDSRGDNIKARLMELNDLKQQGRINENEYDEQKNLSLLEI
jgi:uncharacterized membrane protein YhaH (DUF805 family)